MQIALILSSSNAADRFVDEMSRDGSRLVPVLKPDEDEAANESS